MVPGNGWLGPSRTSTALPGERVELTASVPGPVRRAMVRWETESLLTASLGPDGCVETRVWFFYGLGMECDSHRVAMVAAVVAHLFSQRWCNLTPSFLRSEA